MKPASSLARKATARAMSPGCQSQSGLPTVCHGCTLRHQTRSRIRRSHRRPNAPVARHADRDFITHCIGAKHMKLFHRRTCRYHRGFREPFVERLIEPTSDEAMKATAVEGHDGASAGFDRKPTAHLLGAHPALELRIAHRVRLRAPRWPHNRLPANRSARLNPGVEFLRSTRKVTGWSQQNSRTVSSASLGMRRRPGGR